jgi:hypothetical protein
MTKAGHSALRTLNSALFEWSPRLVSRQRLLLFREALICLSYSGWSSRQVTLLRLPVIDRVLCY